MKYTLGAYTMDTDGPFKNLDAAVKFIQKRHPELTREDAENHLTPKVKDHGTDNSEGTGETAEKGGESSSGTRKGRAEAVEHAEVEPAKPAKR